MFRDPFKVVPLLISACVAVLVYLLIYNTLQFTAQRVELLGYFPATTEVTVRNLLKNGHVEELGSISIEGGPDLQRVATSNINKHIHRLELEFDNPSNELITLSRIRIFFPYLEVYYFTEGNVSKYFSSPQSSPQSSLQYSGENIVITSDNAVARPSMLLALFFSAVFFIGAWLLLRSIAWSELPAFADLKLGNRVSSAEEFDTINGIRGLAALLVLFSHSAPGFTAVQMGLSLLFVISGFLLAKPFVLDVHRIFSTSNVKRFLVKRLRRILPMYYFYVFIIFCVPLDLETFARHILFLQGDGHLWAMVQIFLFYMLLPLVLLISSAAHRLHRLAPIVFLIVACVLSYQLLDEWELFYNGRFSHKFYLYAFLLGVLASYLHFDILVTMRQRLAEKQGARQIIGGVTLVIIVLAILWSAPIQPIDMILVWISQFWVKCTLSAIIIILALNANNTVYSKLIGNWLFRSIGVIGFSFYLLHGLGMEIYAEVQEQFFRHSNAGERSWDFVLGAFVVTYIMSLLTYSYIERPFFGIQKARDKA